MVPVGFMGQDSRDGPHHRVQSTTGGPSAEEAVALHEPSPILDPRGLRRAPREAKANLVFQ